MLVMIGAVLPILFPGWHVSPRPFDPIRDLDTVASCQMVYSRLEYTSARLRSRQPRTDGVVQGYRGSRRLAPFVEAATAGNADSLRQAQSMPGILLFQLIGNAQIEAPRSDPNAVEADTYRQIAQRCDSQLARWRVPASEAMPEDVARIGYAEFRLNGKTAAETFTHGPTAALARATCEGTAEDVARAASAGGNPNQAGLGDVTPLIWAIACENIPNIEAVLAVGGNPNQPFPHFGSPVIIATGYRNPEILRSLLRHGGDPNATDDHETALSTAYTMGRFGAPWTNFDTLMAAGADLNRPSPDGDTIVETAAMFRDFEHVLQFLERGYAGDLVRLGRFVTMDDGNLTAPAQSYLTRTREWLTRHGVRFPVPALGELQRDSRGFYIQP